MSEPERRFQVRLLDYPVAIWLTSNQWFEEVRREISLAGLSGDPEAGRLGRSISQLVTRHAAALGDMGGSGTATLWTAHEHGLDRIDVGYQASSDVAVTAPLIRSLVDDLERRCRDGLLLTLPPGDEVQRLMQWIPEQLLGQLHGGQPAAWPGPWAVTA